ncbi:MAG TPA: hypothetical protein VM845_01130 [Burkholderiaceae bacterium]|nr:hypothetical protein [Burkholderiaceae bacterium]
MTTKNRYALALLAALSLLTLGATAQEAPRSLNDARQNLRSGSTPGIVIWEPAKTAAQPAVPASAPAAAGTAGPGMNAAKAEPPGSGSALGRMFSTLREHSPPSGRSLGSAKKLDAPAQGIPLPTAPAASAGGR